MTDRFNGFNSDLSSPSSFDADITPNDGADLPNVTRGIYIGVGGDVRMTLVGMPDGTSRVYTNMAQGMTHEKRIKRVWATGTTATGLVGEW
jgi:hypothetical protein